jgi:hypothetical protein
VADTWKPCRWSRAGIGRTEPRTRFYVFGWNRTPGFPSFLDKRTKPLAPLLNTFGRGTRWKVRLLGSHLAALYFMESSPHLTLQAAPKGRSTAIFLCAKLDLIPTVSTLLSLPISPPNFSSLRHRQLSTRTTGSTLVIEWLPMPRGRAPAQVSAAVKDAIREYTAPQGFIIRCLHTVGVAWKLIPSASRRRSCSAWSSSVRGSPVRRLA